MLPWPTRARALLGDHGAARRPLRRRRSRPGSRPRAGEAPVTLVEYGDFECPYCGRAEQVVRELLRDFGDVRYVWRHLPLNDVHANAQLAAEAAEAAADRGASGKCTDRLLANQDALRPGDLLRYAEDLGLDLDRFTEDLRTHAERRRSRRSGQCRPQRRVRHADVLRQRPSSLRRVRHGHAVGRCKGGGCPRPCVTTTVPESSLRG